MNRPSTIPRRIEVGDLIRSPDFARGYPSNKPHLFYVGQGDPRQENIRMDDPARGASTYTVTEARERSDTVGGFLVKGLVTMEWHVRAERICEDGSVETIIFTQFCTSLFGGLDYFHVIPLVDFINPDPNPPKVVEDPTEIGRAAYRGIV